MYLKLIQARAIAIQSQIFSSSLQVNSCIRMPSQLVKCAFAFRSFNSPETKCAHLSLKLGTEQGACAPSVPPMTQALCMFDDCFISDGFQPNIQVGKECQLLG